MNWSEMRQAYPDKWLVIEALEAHSDNAQRQLDRIAVLEICLDGKAAFDRYQRLHDEYPFRELYYVHTGREMLDIRERHWVGIRGNHAAYAKKVEIEIGGMNYGFPIDGILGMDLLTQAEVGIDLRNMTLDFP